MERFRDTTYLVSRDGRVWSEKSNRFLKGTNKDGYTRVHLNKLGKFYLHRMVLEVYIPNPENKATVNHKNGDKSDNRVENLEWCTHKENLQHAHATGLSPKGESHVNSKLTNDIVFEIYKLTDIGLRQIDIAKRLSLCSSRVHMIVNGNSWSHLYKQYYGLK